MDVLNDIYATIAAEGFTAGTLQMIDNYAKDIQNGREDFSRFNLSEHAGLCKGGSPLIGASIISCYATASLRASCNAEGREGSPANWEIDKQSIWPTTYWLPIYLWRTANFWVSKSIHPNRHKKRVATNLTTLPIGDTPIPINRTRPLFCAQR